MGCKSNKKKFSAFLVVSWFLRTLVMFLTVISLSKPSLQKGKKKAVGVCALIVYTVVLCVPSASPF